MGQQGQGFSKRNPLKMTVAVDDVQKMQQGYEDRISRQAASIDRVMALLNDRTNQLARQMEDENSRAADWGLPPIEHVRVVGRGQVDIINGDDQTAIDRLWSLVPEDWDQYNEDDNKATALAGYIKWLQSEVEHQKAKGGEWARKSENQAAIIEGYKANILAGEKKLTSTQSALDEANRNLAQAITDARNNAKVANAAFKQVQNDSDDPPWLEGAKHTIVAPTLLERHTPAVVLDPVRDGESETVAFEGFRGHAGEQRPGSF